eukprot:TRINITY_DN8301_c0_g1_i1.p5 TRINITY_DN8301_c0_g1~~TRINITY_DN8301_c0_g1_i1.p5  ORF type:complete len:154 (+),score=20.99 TRINITY_DN8301_c0_g1_i1:773-1234(+)
MILGFCLKNSPPSFKMIQARLSNQNIRQFFNQQRLTGQTKLRQHRSLKVFAHKVEIEHEGQVHVLDVESGQTILEVALEQGLELPHDCKMGVCMTCPAKLVSGNVDQSASIMSEDVAEKGYALLCVAEPLDDCRIKTVPEDELLDEQLVTSSM